jgi:hypothetical protein
VRLEAVGGEGPEPYTCLEHRLAGRSDECLEGRCLFVTRERTVADGLGTIAALAGHLHDGLQVGRETSEASGTLAGTAFAIKATAAAALEILEDETD